MFFFCEHLLFSGRDTKTVLRKRAVGENTEFSQKVNSFPNSKGCFFSDDSDVTNKPDAKTQLSIIF